MKAAELRQNGNVIAVADGEYYVYVGKRIYGRENKVSMYMALVRDMHQEMGKGNYTVATVYFNPEATDKVVVNRFNKLMKALEQ